MQLLFEIFDILALWRSALSVRVPGCQKLQIRYDTIEEINVDSKAEYTA